MHIRVFPLGDGPTWPPPAGPGTSQARPVAGIPRVTGGVPTTSHRGRAFLGSRDGYRKVHFMRFKNSYAAAVAAAVAAVVFSAAFQPAEASFIFYAEQVGADVVITGTGSFNTTTLASSGTLTTPVTYTGDAGMSGRSIYVSAVSGFNPDFSRYTGALGPASATISGLGTIQETPSATSGDYVIFLRSALPSTGYSLRLLDTYTSNAPLSNSITFAGFTLSSLGWSTAGTWASPVVNSSFTLANSETIQFVTVPEPTHMVSVAGIGAALGAWRLRKLRRSREAAGNAIAS
jgi:hypothetical protein